MPRNYDPSALPLRNHKEFMQQAQQVQYALTAAESERLAQKYGIKGIPLLSILSSLSFPASFPYDFMHLVWANLIPNLILLWTGQFKHLDHSEEGYVFAKSVWEAIGEATAEAGKTIPAAFGTRIPNIALEKRPLTAEMRSIWTVYLAPSLLRGRFHQELYYKHFLSLVRLLKLCLEFELSIEQVDELEAGFNAWVTEYESCCTTFIKNYPSKNLLSTSMTFHSLGYIMIKKISNVIGDPSYVLTSPKRISVLKPALWEKFTAAIATRFTKQAKDIRNLFPKPLKITEYGRVRRLGGGDAIQARELVALRADGRDMSFVRH
ncbi:hypothetical protein M378DRAFT_181111 [Amanita muscaria Koide BX008]|uniref:Uncharacterized protein n=1 Tax=Amanita muscaria (strain Koide BX008) TaxID=946122 RepID=A0A0C2WBX7_AMAMK|nr:hypothetical protein M378DRAFT_181111 [Amanita muscaria Koide BX008]